MTFGARIWPFSIQTTSMREFNPLDQTVSVPACGVWFLNTDVDIEEVRHQASDLLSMLAAIRFTVALAQSAQAEGDLATLGISGTKTQHCCDRPRMANIQTRTFALWINGMKSTDLILPSSNRDSPETLSWRGREERSEQKIFGNRNFHDRWIRTNGASKETTVPRVPQDLGEVE